MKSRKGVQVKSFLFVFRSLDIVIRLNNVISKMRVCVEGQTMVEREMLKYD